MEPHGNPLEYLPHDFPNHGTVYANYAVWRDERIFGKFNHDLVLERSGGVPVGPDDTSAVSSTG
ncbi:hypothetical protein ACFU6I_33000 [Streptomyces sp. NPDC057486]|uniref:hypothetical protein n=1 Tax=Streptomyces sp. NPDC057486 TaxID=3346145 RepID=UPI0036AE6A56